MIIKHFKTVLCLFMCFGITINSESQNDFTTLSFEGLNTSSLSEETVDLATYSVDVESYKLNYSIEDVPKSITEHDAEDNAVSYAMQMLAFGAGFGINSDQTLWCLHAEYYLRLAMLKRAAVYGAIGAMYNGANSDLLTTSLFDITLKALVFQQLVQRYQQVRFLYGLAAAYGFGSEKFEDGFKYDLTRLTIGLVVGFQMLLSPQWSLMLQTNVFNYQEQTRSFEEFETTDYSRWALINKRNLVLFSLIYTLGNSNR